MKNKMPEIMDDIEMATGLTARLRRFETDEPNAAEAKAYASVLGKLLSLVKLECDVAHNLGAGPTKVMKNMLPELFDK
jgi:hypothetical protein